MILWFYDRLVIEVILALFRLFSTTKHPDEPICPIQGPPGKTLYGQHYLDWKRMLVSLIRGAGYWDVFSPRAELDAYIDNMDNLHYRLASNTAKSYFIKQEGAKVFIMEKMTYNIWKQVGECKIGYNLRI